MPATQAPPTSEDEHGTRPLPVSRAVDILPDPRSALPRYAAYFRARHRFWEAFPEGQYVRLPTPGTDLECGFHALILSMRHQLGARCASGPGSDPGGEAGSAVRVPTLEELRAVFRGAVVQGENAGAGMANLSWFTADQLAAVFAEWGRRFLGGGQRCQMGWVTDRDEELGLEGWPVMMNTPDVETGEVGEGIVRVWVWNDGGSLRGGIGHFEGIRRPTQRELAVMGDGQ
ncbi:hypothetical protein MYCTH_2309874 [Thermothelomyces thermophilus ATCC 42464]|uniref:Uncharacterized protein n=1 Tax=Thermothelomyces thermophilus (strain ATCC 42464 / BCRC 31852 / DSM 1799) TaxID=573729 RepID=G2QKT2_THET4|nr:uncharacterized protein MYCTH_2309874 [Thermothelomyces thermophilus ATCC 42464]AEO60564.1 hypothetical protein MYCTH_2309874 [Thermothelomyces thermophilus ATCC 42464]